VKLLWLAPYLPWPPLHGGQIRTANLIQGALKAGHTIELWCPATAEVDTNVVPAGVTLARLSRRERVSSGEKLAAAFARLPEAAWQVADRNATTRLRHGSAHFAAAVVSQAHMSSYMPALIEAGLPVILDCHNVEWVLTQSIAQRHVRFRNQVRFRVDGQKFRRLERQALRLATAVGCVSQWDRAGLASLSGRGDIEVYPNGVDNTYFRPPSPSSIRRETTLLLTGTIDFPPNRDACYWLRDEILPGVRRAIPNAKLQLVGQISETVRRQFDRPEDGLMVIGGVPDVRPYMAAASVFVIPLRFGSGTPIKVLEAAASGLPIVATREAIRGFGEPGCPVVVSGPSSADLIRDIVGLLRDPSRCSALGLEGRRWVTKSYDWEDISADFALLVERHARR
jgi:glycosyltransferase involved in cell wall biosynthesis